MNSQTAPTAQRSADKIRLAERIAADKCVTIIINTRSRKGQKLFDHACQMFTDAGFRIDRAHAMRDPSQLDTTVCEAIAGGATLVAVGGGDGTLSSVSRHFIGTDAVFGVLPLGTANSFARTLGIPGDMKGAIDVLANGRVEDVDLGRVGDHYFVNAAAIGLPAMIGETIPHGLKAVLGRVGYLGWAAYQLARLKSFHVTLTDASGVREFEALEVRVNNGRYLGGMEVAAEASVESLDLVVQVVTGRNGWTLARSWALSALGRRGGDGLVSLRTAKMRIETDPPMSVSVDGEVLAKTPIDISVARQVLKIMVPKDQADL